MKFDTAVFEKPIYKVNPNLKSHANDPFVKKKMAIAIEILRKLKKASQDRESEVEG